MAAAAGIAPLLSPIDADLSDSQFGRIQGVAILFAILPTVVVALRFLARKLSKAGLWWDDWTILAALIVSWGTSICMLIALRHGFGRHIAYEPDLEKRLALAQTWFKLLYGFETIYTVSIVLCKISILLFYSRIFKERKFTILLRCVGVSVIIWFIAIEASVLAECVPVNALWDPEQPGKCINLHAFFQGSGIPNVFLNTIILFLPLPMIWTLDIERRHKLALSGVFLLGSFVVIVSIVRLIILHKLENFDITWTYVDAAIWTAAEPAIAVCSASLPILRSLWIWNRRKRSARRATEDSATTTPKQPPYRPHRPAAKVESGSMSSQQFPLNELSSGQQRMWGNRVTIYSTPGSEKMSGDSDTYAELPIMHPRDSPLARPTAQMSARLYPALKYPESRSELYG